MRPYSSNLGDRRIVSDPEGRTPKPRGSVPAGDALLSGPPGLGVLSEGQLAAGGELGPTPGGGCDPRGRSVLQYEMYTIERNAERTATAGRLLYDM